MRALVLDFGGVISRTLFETHAQSEVAPDQTVFVDDQARNIRGAQAVGMKTVHFDVQNTGPSYHAALDLLEI